MCARVQARFYNVGPNHSTGIILPHSAHTIQEKTIRRTEMENKNVNEYTEQITSDLASGKVESMREAEINLLNELYRNSELGKLSLEKVIKHCEDGELKHVLLSSYEEFDLFSGTVAAEITERGDTPKNNNVFKNTMMKTSIAMTTAFDNSSNKLADMVVQGNNMGIIDVNKLINAYVGRVGEEAMNLARELLRIEQRSLDDLKRFL